MKAVVAQHVSITRCLPELRTAINIMNRIDDDR
jgi:hypothetical protein